MQENLHIIYTKGYVLEQNVFSSRKHTHESYFDIIILV